MCTCLYQELSIAVSLPVYTPVYVFVPGLSIAVSLPVFSPPEELRGVVAIGLSMDELIANIGKQNDIHAT